MDINATLLGEMLTFAVLIWVTMKYIWPPIMAVLEERQQKIAAGLAAAERGQRNLDLVQKRVVKQLRVAKLRALDVVDKAEQQARELVENGKLQARQEGEKLLDTARCDIDREVTKAQSLLQQKTVTLAIQLAEKIIQEKLDPAMQDKLVAKMVEEIR